jgi:hypothetical protein
MLEKIERVKTSLQIQEDIDLHIRGWIFQRIGWLLMLMILISSVLGLFGNGLFSEKLIIRNGSSLTFEQFARRDNETEIEILVPHSSGKIQVALSPAFTEIFKVEHIAPEPREQMLKNGFTVYEFAAEANAQLTFFLTTRKAGRIHSTVQVNDTEFELKQFIYP